MHARNSRPPFPKPAAGEPATPPAPDTALSGAFRKALRAGAKPDYPSAAGHEARELARLAKTDRLNKAPAAASDPKPSRVPGKGHR